MSREVYCAKVAATGCRDDVIYCVIVDDRYNSRHTTNGRMPCDLYAGIAVIECAYYEKSPSATCCMHAQQTKNFHAVHATLQLRC